MALPLSCVDKHGQAIDFLRTEYRDERATKRCLTQAIRRHGVPETMTIDSSGANAAAIRSSNQEHETAIAIRQVKYVNNLIEQDHRGVKRIPRPRLGCKSFAAAQPPVAGIELMHMIRKGLLADGIEQDSYQPNSATPWRLNLLTEGIDSPPIVFTRKRATEPPRRRALACEHFP